MNHQIEIGREIKRKLKRSWASFFSHFGKLLPVQTEAIPLILSGHNIIISSPTASGKTEAVIAPVAEMLLEQFYDGLSLLYVSPTKALVNDLYERLAGPLQEIGLTVSVKTGDRPQFNSSNAQNVLITTPESLDSLICRYPRLLSNLKFIILDEIHLIDKTPRGDQLRILLRRISSLVSSDLKYYALSATMDEPDEIANRYFSNFKVVCVPASREIDYELFASIKDSMNAVKQKQIHKIIIFCNRRNEVEEISEECKAYWPEDHIVVHHGKLDRKIREESENFMRQCHWGICVSTMTLEIGIDIGDIDLIILYGPPFGVSSLLQRIGRGNRRKGRSIAFGIYRNNEELSTFIQLFELAKAGKIDNIPYFPDPSVVVQQIFSCLYQFPGGLNENYFIKLFDNYISTDELMLILSHLRKLEYIELRQGKYFASTKLMDMGERGLIHSNIPDSKDYTVIDATTGRKLGEVSYTINEEALRIAGKSWRIIEIKDDIVYVKPTDEAKAAQFGVCLSKGAFSKFLPPQIK